MTFIGIYYGTKKLKCSKVSFRGGRQPRVKPKTKTLPKRALQRTDNKALEDLTQKIDGKVTSQPLDPRTDYAVPDDAHNGFSIGVDANGYLHVMGDMHHYPMLVKRSPNMPQRYREQNSMYWVSQKPYDVSGGFRYAGALNSPSVLPASSISYPRFHHAPNGDLYLTLLVRAHINPITVETAP